MNNFSNMNDFDKWCVLTEMPSLFHDRKHIEDVFGKNERNCRGEAQAAWNYQQRKIDLLKECINAFAEEGFERACETKIELEKLENFSL